jgi:tetratricopeptide (TPR) repeat protein
MVYKNMGKIDSAKRDFKKAISINPDNSLAQYNLTILDPQDDAISLAGMNEIISKYPNLPFAYANRAYYHYRQDNYQMAIQDYDSAILLDDDNHTYYLERGMCYEKMNRLGETLQNFKTAASLSPGDPDVWFNLGNVYYKQEKYDLAVEAYTRSLQLDNTGGSCYYNRGLIYHLRGEVKKACDDMKNALDLQVESAQYFLNKYCNH